MNEALLVALARLEGLHLGMCQVNFSGLQPKTWDRVRAELGDIKEEIRKASVVKPEKVVKKEATPLKVEK